MLHLSLVTSLAVLALAASARAAELEDMVRSADVVVLGQVFKVTEGEVDPESLRLGVKVRTDVAAIVVREVLKGDPELKKVDVGFPGFPKADEVRLEMKQDGIWFLVKTDRKYYAVKGADRILPDTRLGQVRRAVRAAAGIVEGPVKPVDRAARLAALLKDLGAEQPDATRRLAAFQLGELGEPAAVPSLIGSLSDESAAVRLASDLALRRITGHQAPIDFQNGDAATRARGVEAWTRWWEANKGTDRKQMLLAAAKASVNPQPDYQFAIEGLAQFDDPELLPVFTQVLDAAVGSQNNALVTAAARYLGRAKHRASAPRLVALLDANVQWPSSSARNTIAAAVGSIVGEDFGTGDAAVERCLEWWRTNRDKFR